MSDAFGNWVAGASSGAAMAATEVKAAPGAGKFLAIRKIIFTNGSVANSFVLKDGDATVIFPKSGVIYLGVNQTWDSGKLPADIVLPVANKNLNITTTAAGTAAVSVFGYTK